MKILAIFAAVGALNTIVIAAPTSQNERRCISDTPEGCAAWNEYEDKHRDWYNAWEAEKEAKKTLDDARKILNEAKPFKRDLGSDEGPELVRSPMPPAAVPYIPVGKNDSIALKNINPPTGVPVISIEKPATAVPVIPIPDADEAKLIKVKKGVLVLEKLKEWFSEHPEIVFDLPVWAAEDNQRIAKLLEKYRDEHPDFVVDTFRRDNNDKLEEPDVYGIGRAKHL